MSSSLVEVFGGPTALRQAIRQQVDIMVTDGDNNSRLFSQFRESATENEIRALRTKAKRRSHIYNYERARARHIYHRTLLVAGDLTKAPLAKYSSGDRIMKINTSHHPILVKVLVSELLSGYPKIKSELFEGSRPQYPWSDGERSAQMGRLVQIYSSGLTYATTGYATTGDNTTDYARTNTFYIDEYTEEPL